LKSIACSHPVSVQIGRKTGAIYVFSWYMPNDQCHKKGHRTKDVPFRLSRFKSFDDPRCEGRYGLHVTPTGHTDDRSGVSVVVDEEADTPRVWIWTAHPFARRAGDAYGYHARIFELRKGKMALKANFAEKARKQVRWLKASRHMKSRLYFNPKTRRLYVGELFDPCVFHATCFFCVPRIDPDTGKVTVVNLPAGVEDMAFDIDGRAYLRGGNTVGRFDPATWREVPFDYGEERRLIHQCKAANTVSVLSHAGSVCDGTAQGGGMWVSPRGHVVVTVNNPARSRTKKDEKKVHTFGVRKYTPQMYPGRARPWEVHVWDKHGKIKYADAVPGPGRMSGIWMDRDDNLYVMVAGVGSVGGKKYWNPISCSAFKMRPKTKILSARGVVPLNDANRPKRPPDVYGVDHAGNIWIPDALWVRGGVGINGKRAGCMCPSQSRAVLDFYARLFLPETDRYSVLVIDTNNNEIVRVGRYGNVDDGMPLVKQGGPPNPRSIGGDEVALMHPQMLATETDRRLFIGDLGNQRIVCVKLGYHAEEKVALKDVKDRAVAKR
jgi:hypothetical protein